MDESAIKGLELLELNGSDADTRKSRSIKIIVEGYDTSLPEDDVKSALRKHFSSCGEITHVYIPRDVGSDILNIYAFITILGEGAKEKALSLSGSDVGGWNVVTEAYPCAPRKRVRDLSPEPDISTRTLVSVTGHDTSLPEDDIKTALSKHCASCGVTVYVKLLM